MKVISIRKNKVTLELTEQENDILFRSGLQLWIDKEIGANKVKVLPVGLDEKKPKTCIEVDDEFNRECIEVAVIDALKIAIARHK